MECVRGEDGSLKSNVISCVRRSTHVRFFEKFYDLFILSEQVAESRRMRQRTLRNAVIGSGFVLINQAFHPTEITVFSQNFLERKRPCWSAG